MLIRDMGEMPKDESKKTVSGIKPVERFPKDKMEIVIKSENWMPIDTKTKPIHDSIKHVMHNRNHTMKGVGRHS